MIARHHFDQETGLHYNYFRDYDPGIGRYVQSDPIGLYGGKNTFGYVGGNPLGYVDATGEQATLTWCFGGPVACAVGVCAAAATSLYGIRGTMNAMSGSGSGDGPGSSLFPISTPCPDESTCSVKDPCKGLRDILRDHEKRLQDYINNPLGPSDNKNLLNWAFMMNDGGRAQSIYDGRIRKLKGQIEAFKKDLAECERKNGKK